MQFSPAYCCLLLLDFVYSCHCAVPLELVTPSGGGQIRLSGIQICLSFKVNSLRQYCG